MKKAFIIAILILVHTGVVFSQVKTNQVQAVQLKSTIVGFLKWYKKEGGHINTNYTIVKNTSSDSLIASRIDKEGLEGYLSAVKKSGFVSDAYIDQLKRYFIAIDEKMAAMPKTQQQIKIDGLDKDWILNTFEPEMILDNVDKSIIQKNYIIYHKALTSLYVSPHIVLVFTLTKYGNHWLIDDISNDASDKQSFFKQ